MTYIKTATLKISGDRVFSSSWAHLPYRHLWKSPRHLCSQVSTVIVTIVIDDGFFSNPNQTISFVWSKLKVLRPGCVTGCVTEACVTEGCVTEGCVTEACVTEACV